MLPRLWLSSSRLSKILDIYFENATTEEQLFLTVRDFTKGMVRTPTPISTKLKPGRGLCPKPP